MKNIKSVKLILVIMAVIMVVMSVSTKVFASNQIQLDVFSNGETNEVQQPSTTANQEAGYTNSNNLPQTGDASDYAIFALIAICIVASIYAYKKVREYNIK